MIGHSQQAANQVKPSLNRILLIFDASQSMYGYWQSDSKINIAKKLMMTFLDSLAKVPNVEVALRVYGHQKKFPPQDCDDTKLEIPFGNNNIAKIKNRIQSLTPRGTTPIAAAMREAVNDFPPCDTCRNILVLITDGQEECGGDPCAVAAELIRRGIFLKPFIIGIGKDFSEAFKCVGTYFDATSEQALNRALQAVMSHALASTTLQINLLDPANRPSVSNVNMTFIERGTGAVKYNFIHTLDVQGRPDTLKLDPLIVYDVIIHTTPARRIDSLVLAANEHNVRDVPSAQGAIMLTVKGNNPLIRNLSAIVYKQYASDILNVQSIGENKKYLAGIYDIEVLSLPRIRIDGVVVTHNQTTTVEIPVPGVVIINKAVQGYGSLYVHRSGQQIWVYDLRENLLQESLILMPGDYTIYYRAKNSNKAIFTTEKDFRVLPGESKTIRVN